MKKFAFAHPEVKTRINRIYNSSFPGSVLWDLSSKNSQMIMNSWSVAVRHMWGLPHNAHRYLIEMLGGTHAKTMLMSRFIKFIQSIKKSPKKAVQFLFEKVRKNVNTVTGRNMAFVERVTGKSELEKINIKEVMKNVKYCESKENAWRADFIKEIVDVKNNGLVLLKGKNEEYLTKTTWMTSLTTLVLVDTFFL